MFIYINSDKVNAYCFKILWWDLSQRRKLIKGHIVREPEASQVVKNLPANIGDARDSGLIPESGRPAGVGNDNPLQCSCLENYMDREAWQKTVHGVAKRQTWLSMQLTGSVSEGTNYPDMCFYSDLCFKLYCLFGLVAESELRRAKILFSCDQQFPSFPFASFSSFVKWRHHSGWTLRNGSTPFLCPMAPKEEGTLEMHLNWSEAEKDEVWE